MSSCDPIKFIFYKQLKTFKIVKNYFLNLIIKIDFNLHHLYFFVVIFSIKNNK